MENDKIDDELTYRFIGCAMRVHAVLGNGFQEVIYQRAMVIEWHPKNKMASTIPCPK